MQKKEVKKTAGTTDCFHSVSLPLICWSSSGQSATSGRRQPHHWEITMSNSERPCLSSSHCCGCHVCLADVSNHCDCAATWLRLPIFLQEVPRLDLALSASWHSS